MEELQESTDVLPVITLFECVLGSVMINVEIKVCGSSAPSIAGGLRLGAGATPKAAVCIIVNIVYQDFVCYSR